jgi:hypothetical protein
MIKDIIENHNTLNSKQIILLDEEVEKLQEFCDWAYSIAGKNIENELIELLNPRNIYGFPVRFSLGYDKNNFEFTLDK